MMDPAYVLFTVTTADVSVVSAFLVFFAAGFLVGHWAGARKDG